MQIFDLTLKDLLIGGSPALFRQIAAVDDFRMVPLELPAVTAGRVDLFGEEGGDSALQIEIQAQNLTNMPIRMLGYLWLALRQRANLQLRQIVLFVGSGEMTMSDRLQRPSIQYQYELINARTLDPDPLLASDYPSDIIMAFFAAGDDVKARVRTVVMRLAARFKDDPNRLKDALVRLTLLAPLRNAAIIVEQEIAHMPITIDLETHPFASKFFLKGQSEGRAATLTRQLTRRFGQVSDQHQAQIQAANPDQLDAWLDAVLDAPSPEAVFAARH